MEPQREMKGVSFIIVSYFTADYVVGLVQSIEKYVQRFPYEILILDNSGSVEERKLLTVRDPIHQKVVFSEMNIGFVAANNLLFSRAQHDLIVLLNPDTLLIDNSLETLFDYCLAQERVGVVGPMLLNEDGTQQVGHYKFPGFPGLIKEHIFLWQRHPYAYHGTDTQIMECDVIKGSCMVFRKNIVDASPVFDPDLVMYSEEVDLCDRMRRKGLINIFFPKAKIVHYGERSSMQRPFALYSTYHYYRSKLVYFRKRWSLPRYWLARAILFVSLLEKAALLGLAARPRSAKIHWQVWVELFWTDGKDLMERKCTEDD